MDCSICLEQIQEGQPDTILNACNHRFHQKCIDPWMASHSTCPNCRGEIRSEQEVLDIQRQQELRELDRVYMTYIVYTWILQRFQGTEFKRYSNRLFSFLSQIRWQAIRPIAFPMTPRNRKSLSSLKALRAYCISREKSLFQKLFPGEPYRAIHRNPRCLEIRTGIYPELLAFQQSLS